MQDIESLHGCGNRMRIKIKTIDQRRLKTQNMISITIKFVKETLLSTRCYVNTEIVIDEGVIAPNLIIASLFPCLSPGYFEL